MNCPYCNREMEKGIIQSSQELSWTRDKHIMASSEFNEGSVLLAELSFTGTAVVSYLCRECKKVIIDYDAEHDLKKIKKEKKPFWKKLK